MFLLPLDFHAFVVFRLVSRLFARHVGGPVAEVEGPVAEAIDADGDGASDASRIFVPLTVWPRGTEFGDERETLENLHFPRDQLFIILRLLGERGCGPAPCSRHQPV